MDKVLKDERFAKVVNEKKFRSLSKKERKVQIDNRFQSVFKDERFVSSCDVDSRGRPKHFGSKENYKKYYDLKGSDESESESSDSEDENEDDESDDANEEDKDDIDADLTSSEEKEEVQTDDGDDSDSDEDDLEQVVEQKFSSKAKKEEKVVGVEEENIAPVKIDPNITAKLQNLEVDYARGEANLYSDSSSGESSEEEDDEEETAYLESLNKWGELDQDAELSEEITSRLAVCNMDWDKIQADDIFLALSSFCPAGGCIKSVNVYVSEYGKSRMEEEDRMGPAELIRLAEENKKVEEAYEDILDLGRKAERDEELAMQRLREYQLNRLKYYYAVTEFDSEDTANSVYTECDGNELEASATVFDLRFIPADTTFEDPPVSSCTSIPERSQYRPKYFSNSALTGMKVKLSWDEQDAEREHKMKTAYKEIDNDDEDFSFAKGLIASASEDEEEEEEEKEEEEKEEENEIKKSKTKKLKKKSSKGKKDAAEDGDEDADLGSDDGNSSDDESDNEDDIDKYRSLIFGLDKDKKKVSSGDPGDMEITWQHDSDDDDEEDDDKQSEQESEQDDEEELTPFEKTLKKNKDRRDRKRAERLKKYQASDAEHSDDENPDDVDLNDPFFAEEYGMSKAAKPKKKMSKKRKHDDDEASNDEGKDDLALLVLDEEDDSKHFNYKAIVKEETKSKSKKKKWKKNKKEEVQDDFYLNVDDDRFAAIYSRPEFNIDPSATKFKKTKAMETLIDEKQKRLTSGPIKQKTASKPVVKDSKNSKLDAEITASLNAVKNKWAKNSKKKKI